MIQMRSTFCWVLALLMVFTFTTNSAFADNTKDQSAVVTSHDPKSRMSEVKKVTEKKSGSGWLWGILGILVVGGGIAALAGGGSDSGGGDDGGGSTTGNYDFSW